MIGKDLPQAHQRELQRLLQADRGTLKQEFSNLPPASISETYGEYDAQLLDQGGRFADVVTRFAFGTSGPWIGKAFRPLGLDRGEGYNAYGKTPESRYAKLRMDTYIAESAVSPGDSFILNYRNRNWGLIRWLVGELREVNPSVLLGMGTFGPRAPRYRKLRRVIPFILVGPTRPYLGESSAVAGPIRVAVDERATDAMDARGEMAKQAVAD